MSCTVLTYRCHVSLPDSWNEGMGRLSCRCRWRREWGRPVASWRGTEETPDGPGCPDLAEQHPKMDIWICSRCRTSAHRLKPQSHPEKEVLIYSYARAPIPGDQVLHPLCESHHSDNNLRVQTELKVYLNNHDNHLEANVAILINCRHNSRLLNSGGERKWETSIPMTQNHLETEIETLIYNVPVLF